MTEIGEPQETIVLAAEHAYDRPGTHFAVLRATVQREGDPVSAYGRVQNLSRVRIVVG